MYILLHSEDARFADKVDEYSLNLRVEKVRVVGVLGAGELYLACISSPTIGIVGRTELPPL